MLATLTIAGTFGHDPHFPERDYTGLLQRLSDGRDVRFVGGIPEDELPGLYRRARALVLFDQEHGWSREEHYRAGEIIVAEGEPVSVVYVVRKGSVKRTRMDDGKEVIVSMVHEGQTFGGVALLEGRPHSAAAVAVTEVELVTFNREQFLQATATAPELHDYLGAVDRVYAMSGGLVTLFEG
jgi:glycosyltransferase involved in cell wall biosynthesis